MVKNIQFIIILSLLTLLPANSYIITNSVANDNNIKVKNFSINPYENDLSQIELNLFGKRYSDEGVNDRISRIEKSIFNQTLNSLSTAQRVNNILANYSGSYAGYNSYYGLENNKQSLINRLQNALIGQPTGYTPPVNYSPYLNSFGPSYMQNSYGTNGWRYQNATHPAMTGAGIHILQ